MNLSAAEAMVKWMESPRDRYADCRACEQHERIRFLLAAGREEEALELSVPILEGRMTCSKMPHLTFAILPLMLARAGRFDEAVEIQKKGYRLISRNTDFLEEIGHHMIYLTLSGKPEKALRLFEKHLRWATESRMQIRRFRFFLGSTLTFLDPARIRTKPLRLRFATPPPFQNETNVYEIESLSSWCREQLDETVRLLDQRNGNRFYRDLAEQTLQLPHIEAPAKEAAAQ